MKVTAYQAKNGKLYSQEDFAALADLRELKSNIENTWLPENEENRMRALLTIEECFDNLKSDLEKYKKAYRKYEEFFKASHRKKDYANI